MSRKRLLISWVGLNDMRAFALSLPEAQRDEILTALPGVQPEPGERGPIGTLVDAEPFDEILLLYNLSPDRSTEFAAWLSPQAQVIHLELQNPTDYGKVFEIVNAELGKLKSRPNWAQTELCIHLSPGTPTMTAIWLLLGKSRYPATFYQTYKGKAWRTDVPFDLAVDYVPEVFRDADSHLQHLASQSPSEIEGFEQVIGDSPEIRLAVGRAQRAAIRNVPVLLLGESGTGKELFARAIHNSSSRRSKPFLAINCAAISRELLESELFGHKKGAFTGAQADRAGAFEQADGGTLFLDEIGECDPALQTKLLRVLQPPEGDDPCLRLFHRVGDLEERRASVRVVAATNRDLAAGVRDGSFREDLFYRLAVITVKLPPLRDRRTDIPRIAERFLQRINRQFEHDEPGYQHKSICDSAKIFVQQYGWPGNVRQLFNVLLQAAVMADGDTIQKHDIADAIAAMDVETTLAGNLLERPLGGGFNLDELLNDIHRHYLRRAMQEAGGVKTRAAKLLGLASYQTLAKQLEKLEADADGG